MTIKILASLIVGGFTVAGSAAAAVEWTECPGSARPHFCDPAQSRGELVVVAPRVGGQSASGTASLIRRPPEIVVLTPRCQAGH